MIGTGVRAALTTAGAAACDGSGRTAVTAPVPIGAGVETARRGESCARSTTPITARHAIVTKSNSLRTHTPRQINEVDGEPIGRLAERTGAVTWESG